MSTKENKSSTIVLINSSYSRTNLDVTIPSIPKEGQLVVRHEEKHHVSSAIGSISEIPYLPPLPIRKNNRSKIVEKLFGIRVKPFSTQEYLSMPHDPLHSESRIIRLLSFILKVTCISYYYFNSFFSMNRILSPVRVRCQINSRSVRIGMSDFIYIIMLTQTFLTPSVTPVTSSNVISMDVAGTETFLSLGGVVGKRVELPCGITPSRRDDTVYMVLWFRGEDSIPIYSLDVRGKPFSGAKHWSAELPFGKRAHFRTVSEPARLVIEDVRISDQGVYRCRVDFRNSPSRETRVNITVAVPPDEPLIYEKNGLNLRGEVGPYKEGSTLDLTCLVRGGFPSPLVYWYLNDELVDSSFHVENEREVINHITVPNIQRSHHRGLLVCRASNTLLIPPVSKTVILELNLRPLTVSILNRYNQLTTETTYEIICESWGSHPAPLISWWLDTFEITGAKVEETSTSNTTISKLLLSPNSSMDGKTLTCSSKNPILYGSQIEDSWPLTVVYAPVLSLRMGSSLNPSDIKEGDDVYFECLIKANPPIHKLSWYHNGDLLTHNRTAGIILSNQSLVLQKVSRPSGGKYSCRSSNQQGVGNSNEVLLDIMYAPTCQSELSGTEGVGTGAIIIAASRLEDVNISCEMDALPNALKFHWTHTNTVGENSEIASEIYSGSGSRSLLRYSIRSEEDFGTIFCWASNSIGTAERPCVYQLVPADFPQPVDNCSIVNRTSTSVEILCEPGFDGGLPQIFFLEAFQTYPSIRRGLHFNGSFVSPSFSLSGLDADGMFHFKIYAVNRKGRSSPTVIDGIGLQEPSVQTATAQDFQKTTIALIIGSASAFILAAVSLMAFIIFRRLHPIQMPVEAEKSYTRASRGSSTQEELYHNHSKKIQNNLSELPFSSKSNYDDDGDPDLIPSKTVKQLSGMVKAYSQSHTSNGEINQHYRNSITASSTQEKIPLRSLHPDAPYTTDPTALSNYATLRGNSSNGLNIKKRETQQIVDVSPFGTLQGKPSSMLVSLDSRLIGQQLASNQLPESCV